MRTAKVAISIDVAVLKRLDGLVKAHVYPNRSRAIQSAVEDKLKSLNRTRLAMECAKLNPVHEAALAEEGLGEEGVQWPEY